MIKARNFIKLYPGFMSFVMTGIIISANAQAHNPILFADVPDMSMIRVRDTYYMSSTTMHMSPGVPIMSYNMATNKETGLSLIVRYWGAEWGNRKFDIYIDDEKLVTEDNTGKWNQSKFFNTEYKIPDPMIRGKEKVKVKFQALEGNAAGAVYYIRVVRQKEK